MDPVRLKSVTQTFRSWVAVHRIDVRRPFTAFPFSLLKERGSCRGVRKIVRNYFMEGPSLLTGRSSDALR